MYVWAIDRLQQRTKLFRKNWLNFCDIFGGHDFLILRNRDVDKKEENKNKNCLVWPLVHKQRQQNIVNNNTRALLSRYQQTINMLTKKRQLIWYFIAVTEWAIISTPKAFFLSHRTAMVYDTDIEIGEYLFSFGWALELGIYIYRTVNANILYNAFVCVYVLLALSRTLEHEHPPACSIP